MLIYKVLFATRIGRMLPPLLCVVLAAAAWVLGGRLGVAMSLGLVLLAVLYKVAAELAGRLTRLEARRRAAQRDTEAAMASMRSLKRRMRATESKLDELTTELQAAGANTATRVVGLEESHQKLVDQVDRVVEGLQPIRRHRLFAGEMMPDLSLESSTEMLSRRLRQR